MVLLIAVSPTKLPLVALKFSVKKFVEEELVVMRLVTKEFVDVLLVVIRSVIVASVAIRLEMKLFVEVLFTDESPTKLPLVAEKFVVKKLVDVELVVELFTPERLLM